MEFILDLNTSFHLSSIFHMLLFYILSPKMRWYWHQFPFFFSLSTNRFIGNQQELLHWKKKAMEMRYRRLKQWHFVEPVHDWDLDYTSTMKICHSMVSLCVSSGWSIFLCLFSFSGCKGRIAVACSHLCGWFFPFCIWGQRIGLFLDHYASCKYVYGGDGVRFMQVLKIVEAFVIGFIVRSKLGSDDA